MIDYFFRWATEADARADAFAAAQHFSVVISSGISGSELWSWARNHVLPDVQVWRPSQDVTSSGVTIHNYLSGWSAIVSLRNQVPALLNSSQLAFALNRDGPPYVVQNNIGAIISDIAVSPMFCGSHYPIGGYSS